MWASPLRWLQFRTNNYHSSFMWWWIDGKFVKSSIYGDQFIIGPLQNENEFPRVSVQVISDHWLMRLVGHPNTCWNHFGVKLDLWSCIGCLLHRRHRRLRLCRISCSCWIAIVRFHFTVRFHFAHKDEVLPKRAGIATEHLIHTGSAHNAMQISMHPTAIGLLFDALPFRSHSQERPLRTEEKQEDTATRLFLLNDRNSCTKAEAGWAGAVATEGG